MLRLVIIVTLVAWAVFAIFPVGVAHAHHVNLDAAACNAKHGPEMVSLGVARYFAAVMEDTIRVLESPPGTDWNVELFNDYLCWTPHAAQPLLVATAEHVLYLAFEVVPAIHARL